MSVVNVKPVIKVLPKIFDHRDKNVRSEASLLTLELYRWVGQSLVGFLADLKPVQLKELTTMFEQEISGQRTPKRYRRGDAQISQVSEIPVAQEPEASTPNPVNAKAPVVFDAASLVDPVNILDSIPKSFFTNIASEKWKERKEALEDLLKLVSKPKLADGRYNELVNILAKKMQDANILVVILAAQCLSSLAKGLSASFAPYRHIVAPQVVERLKEKKLAVIEALRECLDAVSGTTGSILDLLDDMLTGLKHKNPQVKSESIQWTIRSLRHLKKVKKELNKANAKTLIDIAIKCYEDGTDVVREGAAELLGELTRLLTDSVMTPFIERFDKQKQAKIKEYADGSKTNQVAKPSPKKSFADLPKSRGPVNPPFQTGNDLEGDVMAAQPAKKPLQKLPVKPKSASTRNNEINESSHPSGSSTSKLLKPPPPEEPLRYLLTDDSAEVAVSELIGETVMKSVTDASWKTRKESIDAIADKINKLESIPAEAVVHFLCKKPGPKEVNFQVVISVFTVFQHCSKCATFNNSVAALCIPWVVEKLGDVKVKNAAASCLNAFIESTSAQFVYTHVYDVAKKLKSPKYLADTLTWMYIQLSSQLPNVQVNALRLAEFCKVMLLNSNASVRSTSVSILAVLYSVVGPELKAILGEVPQQMQSVLEAEFAKTACTNQPAAVSTPQKRSAPIKNTSTSSARPVTAIHTVKEHGPKVDLASKITPTLLEQMTSSNWKERKESVEELIQIIKSTNKSITPNLSSDLTNTLKQRLNDSNKHIASSVVVVCGMLCEAMGSGFDKYVRLFLSQILAQLSDQKQPVRATVLQTLDKFADVIGLQTLIPSISSSLMVDQPQLRKDLLKWVNETLTRFSSDNVSKNTVDFSSLVQPILYCLQDRNLDVRKSAQATLPMLTDSLSVDIVRQQACDMFNGLALETVLPYLQATESALPKTPSKAKRNAVGGASDTKDVDVGDAGVGEAKVKIGVSLAGAAKPRLRSTSAKKEAATAPTSREATASVPLMSADTKQKEARAQADRGVHKWVFDNMPRRDLVEFLTDQSTGCFSADLHALLFSVDHYKEKDFLAGLKILEDYSILSFDGSTEAATTEEIRTRFIANSDLIFKYLTIRFYDTNTSLMLKTLEVLENVIRIFDDASQSICEYEANSLLPYLIAKVGDPKESIRGKVRAILKTMARVYPVSKLFNFLLKALESKNSRVRAECLDEIALLVQRNGLTSFVPSKILPPIASQIADRDASVRNSALNALTQAHAVLGDELFGLIGKISDKDRDMLVERLKRVKGSNAPIIEAGSVSNVVRNVAGTPVRAKSNTQLLPTDAELANVATKQQLLAKFKNAKSQYTSGSSVEGDVNAVRKEFSLDLNMLGMTAGSESGTSHNAEIRQSAAKPTEAAVRPNRLIPTETIADEDVNVMLTHAVSLEVGMSIDGIKKLEKLLLAAPDQASQRINDIVAAATLQLRVAFTAWDVRDPQLAPACKHIVGLLVQLFSSSRYPKQISPHYLEQCVQEVLVRLLDGKLSHMDPSNSLNRALNIVMVRVIENCDANATFRILLTTLQHSACACSSLSGAELQHQAKHTELVMKCIWKIVKTLPKAIEDGSDIRVQDVMTDLHGFLELSPPSFWKRRVADKVIPQADMPLRTVKTVLSVLVNAMGSRVFESASHLPGDSHVRAYLEQMVAGLASKGSRGASTSNTSSESGRMDPQTNGKTPSTATHGGMATSYSSNPATPTTTRQTLATAGGTPRRQTSVPTMSELQQRFAASVLAEAEGIFGRIHNKEETKQGIRDLHDFIENSQQDVTDLVEYYISSLTSYFQGYVRRGLTHVATTSGKLKSATGEKQRNANSVGFNLQQRSLDASLNGANGDSKQGSSRDADAYQESLYKLQRMFGNTDEPSSTSEYAKTGVTTIGCNENALNESEEVPASPSKVTSGNQPFLSDVKERLARMRTALNS